ncbi:hypothetical protein J2R98_002930, partial [Alkalibacillus filiformis]|nr:hypothetical protein [Alkalibacillus filiformis]
MGETQASFYLSALTKIYQRSQKFISAHKNLSALTKIYQRS